MIHPIRFSAGFSVQATLSTLQRITNENLKDEELQPSRDAIQSARATSLNAFRHRKSDIDALPNRLNLASTVSILDNRPFYRTIQVLDHRIPGHPGKIMSVASLTLPGPAALQSVFRFFGFSLNDEQLVAKTLKKLKAKKFAARLA